MTSPELDTSRIEIGAVKPEELDTMLRIMCDGFKLPYDAAREVFYNDPYFDIENKRVLRVDGVIASCLTIVDTRCWIGNAVVRLAGVAGVATDERSRQRGYAGLLLEETLKMLRERQYPLAALFPFSPEYYRKFGFEMAGFVFKYLTAPSNLPAYPEHRHVRLAGTDDIPELIRMYDDVSHGKSLRCLRDSKRWQFILDHVKQPFVYGPNWENLEGYVLYEHRPGGSTSRGTGQLPPTLRVLELVATTVEARRALIGHLAGQTNVGCIEYSASYRRLDESGLLNFSTAAAKGAASMCSVEAVPGAMARMLDIVALADSLRPNWRTFTGTIGLVMYDPTIESGMSIALVIGNGEDLPRVQDAWSGLRADRFPDYVEGDISAWAQVAVGCLSADDAVDSGLMSVSTTRARRLASELFPQRDPFIPTPDHF